jgi:hypothetical protein
MSFDAAREKKIKPSRLGHTHTHKTWEITAVSGGTTVRLNVKICKEMFYMTPHKPGNLQRIAPGFLVSFMLHAAHAHNFTIMLTKPMSSAHYWDVERYRH